MSQSLCPAALILCDLGYLSDVCISIWTWKGWNPGILLSAQDSHSEGSRSQACFSPLLQQRRLLSALGPSSRPLCGWENPCWFLRASTVCEGRGAEVGGRSHRGCPSQRAAACCLVSHQPNLGRKSSLGWPHQGQSTAEAASKMGIPQA